MWKWGAVSHVLNSMGAAVVLETIPGQACASALVLMLNSEDPVVVIEVVCCDRGCVFRVWERG